MADRNNDRSNGSAFDTSMLDSTGKLSAKDFVALVGEHERVGTQVESDKKAINEAKDRLKTSDTHLSKLSDRIADHLGYKRSGPSAIEGIRIPKNGSDSHLMRIAKFLSGRPNPVTASAIWNELGKEASVKQTVIKAVNAGFITKSNDADPTYTLSDKGVAALNKATEEQDAIKAGSAPATGNTNEPAVAGQ